MAKIAITGASGSLGSSLRKKLVVNGHEVLEFANGFRVQQKEFFNGIKDANSIDILYHLAAKTSVPDSWTNPDQFIEANTMGTANVLEFCRINEISLVYVSSYMYGVPQSLPIDEQHPISVQNPYALSKRLAEEMCIFYGKNYKLNYSIVRPFNVYGNIRNKNLLIPEIINQLLNSDEIKVKDLEPKRDYIFIDDVIDFLVICISKVSGEIYNLGSGNSYSVKEIVDTCQVVWGTDLTVISDDHPRKNEIPETLCDFSKAQKDFGWSPGFSLEQGLTKMKKTCY